MQLVEACIPTTLLTATFLWLCPTQTLLCRLPHNDLLDLIQRLPKAELHVHIEGTLEPDLMFALAKRNNITLPYPSQKAAIAARAHYSDLKSFLFEYNLGMMVLRTEEDFHELATAYLAKAALQNISHVEIFFDAQSHLRRCVCCLWCICCCTASCVLLGIRSYADRTGYNSTATKPHMNVPSSWAMFEHHHARCLSNLEEQFMMLSTAALCM